MRVGFYVHNMPICSTVLYHKDKIEILFHYGGENIWVCVPYDYVKVRDDFK